MGTFYIPERDPAPLCKIMFLRTGLCSATTGLVLLFLYMIIPVYPNPEIHYSIVFLCSVRYSFQRVSTWLRVPDDPNINILPNIIFGLNYKMFNQNISCSTLIFILFFGNINLFLLAFKCYLFHPGAGFGQQLRAFSPPHPRFLGNVLYGLLILSMKHSVRNIDVRPGFSFL